MSLAVPLFIDFRRKGPTKSLVRAENEGLLLDTVVCLGDLLLMV
jgi:hypothetical protein